MSAVAATPAKTCAVKAHTRRLSPSALYNDTSIALMRETGFVPELVRSTLPKPRVRKPAGRKVT